MKYTPTRGKLNFCVTVPIRQGLAPFALERLYDWAESKQARGYTIRAGSDQDWIRLDHNSYLQLKMAEKFLEKFRDKARKTRNLW